MKAKKMRNCTSADTDHYYTKVCTYSGSIKKVVLIYGSFLVIYDRDSLPDNTNSKKDQIIQLYCQITGVIWTVKNPSDDVFVDANYEDGYAQLVAASGNLYDLDLETGDIIPADPKSTSNTFSQWDRRYQGEYVGTAISNKHEAEKAFTFENYAIFVSSKYDLIEEFVAIGGRTLFVYKHDVLSDKTSPKKRENVRLFENASTCLWTVNNSEEDIFFLGAIYKDGRAQLIASSGDLYDLDIETGDITLASRTQE